MPNLDDGSGYKKASSIEANVLQIRTISPFFSNVPNQNYVPSLDKMQLFPEDMDSLYLSLCNRRY